MKASSVIEAIIGIITNDNPIAAIKAFNLLAGLSRSLKKDAPITNIKNPRTTVGIPANNSISGFKKFFPFRICNFRKINTGSNSKYCRNNCCRNCS